MLPALRTGEAIVVGEAVQLPLRAVIDVPAPNRRPDSHDPVVYDADGNRGRNRPRQVEDSDRVLANWRGENARRSGEDL
jgi:DNA helicase HerA-like ATPase